jgi:type IV pilus assembly protein PilB
VPDGVTFYVGQGCEQCNNLGHKGRIAIVEFWEIDQAARDLITGGTRTSEIYRATAGRSLYAMADDALAKVEKGLVNLEELSNVIPLTATQRFAETPGSDRNPERADTQKPVAAAT